MRLLEGVSPLTLVVVEVPNHVVFNRTALAPFKVASAREEIMRIGVNFSSLVTNANAINSNSISITNLINPYMESINQTSSYLHSYGGAGKLSVLFN